MGGRRFKDLKKIDVDQYVKFRVLFPKILQIKSLRNISKLFRYVSKTNSENLEKYFGKFRKVLTKFLKIILKIFKKKFEKFRAGLPTLRIFP